MSQIVTTDTILGHLKEWVENKEPIGPHRWVDAAQKLNVLIGDEHDKLFDLQQQVSKMKVDLIQKQEGKKNVSLAQLMVEVSDLFRDTRRQEARIGQIEEFIRIAKLQARLKDNEFRQQ